MRRLTWCPGGLLRGREIPNEDKFLAEDVEMDGKLKFYALNSRKELTLLKETLE